MATWINLKPITLSKIRQILQDSTYTQNLKNETELRVIETENRVPEDRGVAGGVKWVKLIKKYKLAGIKEMS